MAKGKPKNKKLEKAASSTEPGLEQLETIKEDQKGEEITEANAEPDLNEGGDLEEEPTKAPLSDDAKVESENAPPSGDEATLKKSLAAEVSEIDVQEAAPIETKGKKGKKGSSTSQEKVETKKKSKKGKNATKSASSTEAPKEDEEEKEEKVEQEEQSPEPATEEVLQKKKAKAKKLKKTVSISEPNLEKVEQKKKKGKKAKKSASTSQTEMTDEEGAEQKMKKTPSSSQPSLSKLHGKKKKKDKKWQGKKVIKIPASTSEIKIPASSQISVSDKDAKLKKPVSQPSLSRLKRGKKSQQSLDQMKKGKKSQQSLQHLMSKLSSEIKSRSRMALMAKQSSQWIFTDSIGTEDSDYSYEDIIEEKEIGSTILIKPKSKKGKKDKKEKRKKEKPTTTETDASEEAEPTKKKKKKGKAKKQKEEATEEPIITPQDDVLAEITRMKYLAELEASGEETDATTASEAPPKKKKKKKGPKKKLSKKEKARLAAELAEKARINAEEEAAKAAELERIRLLEERKAAIEKEKREGFEQQIRVEQLEAALEHFNALVASNKKMRADAKAQSEWETYVNCGRLPNPSQCDAMNTFLHLWENMVGETSMEEAAKRTVDMLVLLNDLDDLIDTAEEKNSEMVDNWKWVRLLFRQQQAKSLDVATYRLLRNIEKNLHRIDIPTADYKYHDANIALCLWLRIQLPTPLPNPRRPAKPRIDIDFPEMKMEVQFPVSIDGEKISVRALYVKYDHLSDLGDTFEKPSTPVEYDLDLLQAMKVEWREKLLYKYQNRVRKTPPIGGEEGENPPEAPPEDEIGSDEEVPIVPYRKLEPTASEYVIVQEDTLYSNIRSNLMKIVPDDVINLRRYSIIGGVYSLNLIHQPPQPQDFVTLEMNLTPLYLPKQLEMVDISLDYTPPQPAEPGVRRPPEEIEEEMKKQEEELERLILVTMTWPDHVIFLELPMVCFWDEKRRVWTKDEIHDLKHNEEKGQLSFRTRKGGTFALAVYRYANLPYQAWEMRPEVNGTISLQITAAILMVEFNVKDGLIALSQLQNSPNNALQDVVGTYFPLPTLIRMMQGAGVDVFPAFDAFCYIEGTCEKHWPMEKHLYFNMAQLGMCFNFAWSRWNMAAGRRNVILQMREYNLEKAKQKNHMMLQVTPLSAIYVDCTEVSQTFNEEGIDNMKFYPDLFHLMKGTSSMAVKNKIAKASKEMIFALYELLLATRVVSLS